MQRIAQYSLFEAQAQEVDEIAGDQLIAFNTQRQNRNVLLRQEMPRRRVATIRVSSCTRMHPGAVRQTLIDNRRFWRETDQLEDRTNVIV